MADRIWQGTRALAQQHIEAGQQVWLVETVIDENGNVVRDYDVRPPADAPTPHARFGRLINVSHRRHVGYEIFGLMRRDVMARVPEQGAYAHADVWRSPTSYRSTSSTDAPLLASSRATARPANDAPQTMTS